MRYFRESSLNELALSNPSWTVAEHPHSRSLSTEEAIIRLIATMLDAQELATRSPDSQGLRLTQ